MNDALTPVLEIRGGGVTFRDADRREFHAIEDVDLQLRRGEILGLVGESGCGKSTTARVLMGLQALSAGEILLDGAPVPARRHSLAPRVQAIFQNPAGSFNPRRSLLDSVAEPLRVWKRGNATERRERALQELERVGISPQMARRRPSEVSGGQCQRAAIARATVLRPEVLICDEPVSALDVSIQAQILELLAELRAEQGLAMLFISHDLSVVSTLCDRTAVMYAGTVVEQGDTSAATDRPRHPYTAILHDSVPVLTPAAHAGEGLRMRSVAGTVDGRAEPGCRFAGLCPLVQEDCRAARPELPAGAHSAACLHPLEA
ncbi:ABC transporter ATP-binding protein [Nocardioides humi]|uniref:ATP-binding cassette domain-containing protein n=1 Tax=Nocardioides humi TaxID=449461 RepID=A0ABN2AA95_9ACTN|nr:ABC transporter ATP-binding protein [Nocardioides humi]